MAEQLETYGSAGLRVMFMDEGKRENLLKLTLSLMIYMISGRRTTTHVKLFHFLGIVQKYVNLKIIFEESGNQKIFQM